MNILDELRWEFPAWTFGPLAGGLTVKCWRGTVEPASEQTDYYATVSHAGRGRFLGTGVDGKGRTFPTVTEAAEYALGEKAESTKAREGTTINAEVPREYDNGDPETEADKASFAEFARLAPFRKAWPEWAWSSPDADTYIGEVDGETWTCQREPGDSFRAHSSLCSAVCYHEDAYQAMRAMIAWPGAERPKTSKNDATQVRPAHYGGTSNPYECIKVIRAWGLNFELGNVAKYLSRAGKKPGVDAVDDLRKLITYAQMEIERLEEANGNH